MELNAILKMFLLKYVKPILVEALDEYFRQRHELSKPSADNEDNGLLSTQQVCRYLRCNRHLLYQLIRAGKINAVIVGKKYLFTKHDIQQYINTHRG